MEHYFSIKEFAKKLSLHPNTIRKAIKSGRIQAFRLSQGKTSSYRIPGSEINRITTMDLYAVFKTFDIKK